MKIAFFELEGWEKEKIEKELGNYDLILTQDKLDLENISNYKDIDILSIFISSEINREIINKLTNIKFITTRSTGYDHININYCKERNILVSNVPEYGTKTVAEWTIGLMLNLIRKIYYAIDQIKETESFDLSSLRGEELYGKTLGVIGTGKIGKEVIKIAKSLGMNILAYDLYQDTSFAGEYEVKYVNLEELLAHSDVITIHTTLNSSTYHLINESNIRKIKKGAYLINTARGAIVETSALISALKEGIIKGVALDVLEEENEIKEELEILVNRNLKEEEIKTLWTNHVLMKMPNVLITPHNAFNSKEAVERILNTTIENIKAFIEGKPINLVK